MLNKENKGIYELGNSIEDGVYEGIRQVADMVRTTLGPYGRNIIIMDKESVPLATDDGVRAIERAVMTQTGLNLVGSRLVHMSSLRTEQEVGDGTTTTFLMSEHLIKSYLINRENEGQRISPVLVRRELERITNDILVPAIDDLKVVADTQEKLTVVANVSSGSPQIGEIVGKLRYEMGPNGLVTITDSTTREDQIEYFSGYEIKSGMQAINYYGNRREVIFDSEPRVLVIKRPITTEKDGVALVNSYLNIVGGKGGVPLLVYSPGISGDALSVILHNTFNRKDKVSYFIVPMDIPMSMGADPHSILEDICVLSGATLVNPPSNTPLDPSELVNSAGSITRATGSRSRMYLVPSEDRSDIIMEYVENLRGIQSELTTKDDRSEYADLEARLSRLQGKSCVLALGNTTDVERVERRLKYDDAILASHSAQIHGVVLGGGVTYYKLSILLEMILDKIPFESIDSSSHLAYMMMIDALRKPIQWVYQNSGHDDMSVIEVIHKDMEDEYSRNGNLNEFSGGIDMYSGKYSPTQYKDEPIYDPSELLKAVIQNSVSAASVYMTSDNVVLLEDF